MTLKSLSFAIEVLSMFTKENPSWGLRDLSKEMQVSHTIIYRILKTYENKKILVQDSGSKKYFLGPGLAPILATYKSDHKLSDLVRKEMEGLSEVTGESVFLTWKEGYEGVTVEIAESLNDIRFAVSVGTRTPLYIGASAKSIMAFLSKEDQNKIITEGIQTKTDKSMSTPDEIFEDLEKIRDRKWAYTEGEYSRDVFGISTPLFNSTGEVIASLTIAGPIYRINEETKKNLLASLIIYTNNISEILSIYDNNVYL